MIKMAISITKNGYKMIRFEGIRKGKIGTEVINKWEYIFSFLGP